MRKIIFVLDSCRWDNFSPNNDFKLTYSNATFPSACVFFGLGLEGVAKFNPIDHRRKEGIGTRIFVDNPFLAPSVWPFGTLKKKCLSYEYFDEEFCNTDAMLERALEVLQDDDNTYNVIWLMDTHSPYIVDEKATKLFFDKIEDLKKYNEGEDTVSDSDMAYLRDRQQRASTCVVGKIGKFVKDLGNNEYLVTADHGESFGENHRFGHGTDIHISQFKVPYIAGRVE